MSFSDAYVQKRTAKNVFYTNIDKIIDWKLVDNEIVKFYKPGKSATGNPAYSGLLLFKMLLIGIWNGGLSDRDVEEMVCENLSAMRFCGLQLESSVPDHSCLSRFRTALTKDNGFEALLTCINQQLDNHGIIIKSGVKIDASITDTLRKPKGKTTYQIAEDRKEDEVIESEKEKQSADLKIVKINSKGVDDEGRWVLKGGKMHFGYKKHVVTDENGLVLSVITTAANEHDSVCFEELIDKTKLPSKTRVLTDKAYKSANHDKVLIDRKLKNGIQYKAVRNKPLTERQKKFNRLVSKCRYTVERTFGGISKWFTGGIAKYVGKSKTHTQHILESISYNLKRSPRLIIDMEINRKVNYLTA